MGLATFGSVVGDTLAMVITYNRTKDEIAYNCTINDYHI